MRPALLLLAVLLLPGCTGDDGRAPEAFPLPPASSFTEGTCALVAEDVRALGRAASELGDGPIPPADVVDDLEAAQRSLATVAETAEPQLEPLLDAVVGRAGLVRISADAERYTPETSEPLAESYRALVDACTGEGPATPTATTG